MTFARWLFCALVLAAPLPAGAAPEANLIRNGDFEAPFTTIADLADSWLIWGPNEGKIPANITRDATNPHGGRACLRIHRPAHPHAWFGLPVTSRVRNANIIGTMYRAVRLLNYAGEDVVRGATSWKSYSGIQEPGFGVLFHQAPEKRSMIYWLYYHFNRSVGDWVLAMEGTAPFHATTKTGHESMPAVPATPLMATVSEDGKRVFLMAANASWASATPTTVTLQGFSIRTAEGVVLSHGDRSAHPLLERKEDFVSPLAVEKSGETLRFTLPPHSVVFVEVR